MSETTDKSQMAALAWSDIARESWQTTDYSEVSRLRRRSKRCPTKPPAARTIRLAVVGGATLDWMIEPLILYLETLGIDVHAYVGAFNTFALDMLDSDSPLARFQPEVVFLACTPFDIGVWPKRGNSLAEVERLADDACQSWLRFCESVHSHSGCDVVVNNFPPLDTRPLGNLACKLPWDRNSFLCRVNLRLGERAPSYVHFNDVDSLASALGSDRWFDARLWRHAKQPVSFDCLIPYVQSAARVIGAIYGRSAKCLVLDLDNTLWGGVVGDDGVDGIAIGEGDGVSEAFKAFQEYVLCLKERGVMLAVCSKNDEANAKAPFLRRAEMPLKLDDFVAFKANWEPKPDNLRQIAAELNIGLDSMVFVDDNPAEREHVRRRLPQVRVLEITDDPADYPRLLDAAGWFETVAISTEDGQRTEQYQANAARQTLSDTLEDYSAYLAALQQKAVIRPFEEAWLDRITQLTNKSNQFNLTTRRLSRSEHEELARSPDVITAYVRVADRFGDNGLIGVFVGRIVNDELHIAQWLMSCRVLKRGVEQSLCNYIAARCRERGIQRLRGTYIPTEKNALVVDHYRGLGFAASGEEPDGTTHWTLDLTSFQPFVTSIALLENY